MEKFHKILKKFFVGFYSVRISKNKDVNFVKIGPVMILLLTVLAFTQESLFDKPILFWLSVGMLCFTALFGFFYYDLFPSRRPKTEEEGWEDMTTIGYKKEKK